MPSPSTSLATLRPDISGSLTEFDLAMDREGFIWNRVFPVFEVPVSAGRFGRIPVEQLLQNRNVNRNSGAGYNRSKFTFTDDFFATTEYGAEEPVDDRQESLYANYLDAEVVAAQRALDAVLRNAEKRVAATVFNTATWTGGSFTQAVGHAWDDAENATPIDDIELAVRGVWNNSGLWSNALIINRFVFRNLRRCKQIQDTVAAHGAGSAIKATDITAQMLAQCFDLPQVLVAGGTQNLANEGQAASFGKIWSDNLAMVARVATTNDMQEPCIGRVMHWGKDGSTVGGTVETYREEQTRSDIQRVRHDVMEKLLYKEAGFMLSGVTTA